MAQNRITLDVWFLQSKYTKLTEKVSYSDLEGKKWIVEVMQSSTKNKVTKFLHRVLRG